MGKKGHALGELGQNWAKLGKTGQKGARIGRTWTKLGKIGQTWANLGKFRNHATRCENASSPIFCIHASRCENAKAPILRIHASKRENAKAPILCIHASRCENAKASILVEQGQCRVGASVNGMRGVAERYKASISVTQSKPTLPSLRLISKCPKPSVVLFPFVQTAFALQIVKILSPQKRHIGDHAMLTNQ
jgi:hypothetical protein